MIMFGYTYYIYFFWNCIFVVLSLESARNPRKNETFMFLPISNINNIIKTNSARSQKTGTKNNLMSATNAIFKKSITLFGKVNKAKKSS